MTLIDYIQDDTDTTHTSTSWETILTRVIELSGVNIVWISAEYGGEVTNRDVGIRITVDDIEQTQDYHEPSRANGYKHFGLTRIVNAPTTGQVYTIKIEGVVESSPQVLHVRRKSFAVMQE